MKDLGLRGPFALISAGWRYDEDRDEPLVAALGATIHNLRLYQAFQEIEREAPDLAAAHARKQARLKQAKEGYRLAISPAVATLRRLWTRREEDPTWFDAALRHLQFLDELFLRRCDQLHAEFATEVQPERHPEVRAVVARARDLLAGCEAILVAGGHVGILRNRMAFFGIQHLLHEHPVIAWSGGAMVLTDRVLLYHDHTPFGVGTAEMLDRGFGLFPGHVLLPHPRQRLALEDTAAVAILARRLAPARVLGLENGARLAADGTVGGSAAAVLELQPEGTVSPQDPRAARS